MYTLSRTAYLAVLFLTSIAALPLMGQALSPSLAVGTVGVHDGAATDYIQFDGSSYNPAQEICFTAGCGGSFTAQINAGNTATPGNTSTVRVWCADYQLNVTTSSQYITDVSTLANIVSPTDPYVQYGNLTSSGSAPSWNNALTSGLAFAPTGSILTTVDGGGVNSAAYRFTLAAALISQYAPGPTNLTGSLPRNTAIQEAVWYLTSNSTPGTDTAFNFGAITANVSDQNNYAYWLNEVLTNQNNAVGSVNTDAWAVVSGPASIVDGKVAPQSNSYQTFLAEVITSSHQNPLPEPSFYALLGIGLSGLFASARRRRNKTSR
jgi:hypothetical protein